MELGSPLVDPGQIKKIMSQMNLEDTLDMHESSSRPTKSINGKMLEIEVNSGPKKFNNFWIICHKYYKML